MQQSREKMNLTLDRKCGADVKKCDAHTKYGDRARAESVAALSRH
jgi:hypothetical protein